MEAPGRQPGDSPSTTSQKESLTESRLLEQVQDQGYRDALSRFFSFCKARGLKFEYGTVGTSIRWTTPDRAEPISIA